MKYLLLAWMILKYDFQAPGSSNRDNTILFQNLLWIQMKEILFQLQKLWCQLLWKYWILTLV